MMPSWTGTQTLLLCSSSGWLWGFTSVRTEQDLWDKPTQTRAFQGAPFGCLMAVHPSYSVLSQGTGWGGGDKKDNMDLDMGINRSSWRFEYWTHPLAHTVSRQTHTYSSHWSHFSRALRKKQMLQQILHHRWTFVLKLCVWRRGRKNGCFSRDVRSLSLAKGWSDFPCPTEKTKGMCAQGLFTQNLATAWGMGRRNTGQYAQVLGGLFQTHCIYHLFWDKGKRERGRRWKASSGGPCVWHLHILAGSCEVELSSQPATQGRQGLAGKSERENEQQNGKKNLQQSWAFHVVLAEKLKVLSQHNLQDGTAPAVI